MVATYTWVETLAAEAATTIPANLNFGNTIKKDITPLNNPVTAGNESYEKYVRGLWSGSFSRIDNLRFYQSGSVNKTGVLYKCNVTNSSYTALTWATPVASTSSQADLAMVVTATVANIGIGGALANTIYSTSASLYSDYIALQLQSTALADAGAVPTQTFTIKYDEQ